MDEAYEFLSKAGVAATSASKSIKWEQLKGRIDWHLVPLMLCVYTLTFLDKVIYNVRRMVVYAAVMGLAADTHLTGNDFSNGTTYMFLAQLIAQAPNGFILNKFPAGKWLGFNVAGWGVAVACMASAHSYSGVVTSRVFLGIFEAAVAPSLVIIISQWYTKPEQTSRNAVWYLGLGCGQIIGGLLSYAFQHVHHAAIDGWRIMFVMIGCISVVTGVTVAAFIPDSPMTARFLSTEEKAAVLQHVAVNKTGVVNRKFSLHQIGELLLDPQLWLLALITICLCETSGVISTYSATLLRNEHFSTQLSALLNVPSGAVSILAALLGGFAVQYSSHRWLWIVLLTCPAIIGAAVMSFVHSKAGILSGIYLVNTDTATLPLIYAWAAANVAGATKRPVTLSFLSGCFAVANMIGPQTFRAKDAPHYRPAKITVLATLAGGALLACCLFVYYYLVNGMREKKHPVDRSETELSEKDKWTGATDKSDLSFRYVY
ncbi:hypothetical protein BAUCODRAFT_69027 [Baudoinia panamericana UAMH 10762]|uniref:Major facilitator superfamily (MFS) profile domain-containing protein n=1 Tax=Baudoinia panamericana (strain UAMH 10762) TaxID=717646 RepID=M2LSS1_BAUPA|nr:uncharacterized protein BAUCODRAFT_69027 [Baudoinia panamericana UAMH 10762]EMC97522.1 hypothetical protein BAUCODRAFT_69027 [Baudoinia panamericana UAMH 10762]